MAKGKTSSKSEKERYSRYQSTNTYSKNKVRKITRHLKKFPNDECAVKSLKLAPFKCKRKAPITPRWSKSEKSIITMISRAMKRSMPNQITATIK